MRHLRVRRLRRGCGQGISPYRRRRSRSPSSPRPPPSARSRPRHQRRSATPGSRSSAQSAASAGVSSASSPGPCPSAGCATTSTYVRQTPSSITLRVYVVLRGCSTTVRSRTGVPHVRTIRVRAARTGGRPAGAASPPSRACYRAYGSTGPYSAARRQWRPVTPDTPDKAAGVDPRTPPRTSTPPRSACWTPARTSKVATALELYERVRATRTKT